MDSLLVACYFSYPYRSMRQKLTWAYIIEEKLLMPELMPIFKILKNKGCASDLIAEVDFCEIKTEKYFIEVKYGRSRLDPW